MTNAELTGLFHWSLVLGHWSLIGYWDLDIGISAASAGLDIGISVASAGLDIGISAASAGLVIGACSSRQFLLQQLEARND